MPRLSRRAPGEESGQFDVLLGGQLVHQVERLEDEANLVTADLCERPLGEPVDTAAIEPDLPSARPVEAPEEVQQCRLPAAARPHDGQRLTGGDIEIDLVDGAYQPLAAAVLLAQPAGARQGIH